MPKFRLEQELPATRVTKELVHSVRGYLLSKAASLVLDPPKDPIPIESLLTISIEDSLGRESLPSLDEYAPSKFSDSTTRIEIELDGSWKAGLQGLSVAVIFHRSRSLSRMRISCDRPNARELAQGIANGIRDCLSPHEKGLSWLHPPPFIWGICSGGFFFSLLSLMQLAGKTSATRLTVIALLPLAIPIYIFVLPWLRPYTEFDSRATESRLQWWNWFVKGLAGFFVFGVLFALIKDHVIKLVSGNP